METNKTASQILPILATILAVTMVSGGAIIRNANAQSIGTSSQVITSPQGTRARVLLQRALDSTTMEVGDKVRVTIAPTDVSGLPKDCVLVGRVTEVSAATKTAPGIIDISFGALERVESPRRTPPLTWRLATTRK